MTPRAGVPAIILMSSTACGTTPSRRRRGVKDLNWRANRLRRDSRERWRRRRKLLRHRALILGDVGDWIPVINIPSASIDESLPWLRQRGIIRCIARLTRSRIRGGGRHRWRENPRSVGWARGRTEIRGCFETLTDLKKEEIKNTLLLAFFSKPRDSSPRDSFFPMINNVIVRLKFIISPKKFNHVPNDFNARARARTALLAPPRPSRAR